MPASSGGHQRRRLYRVGYLVSHPIQYQAFMPRFFAARQRWRRGQGRPTVVLAFAVGCYQSWWYRYRSYRSENLEKGRDRA